MAVHPMVETTCALVIEAMNPGLVVALSILCLKSLWVGYAALSRGLLLATLVELSETENWRGDLLQIVLLALFLSSSLVC